MTTDDRDDLERKLDSLRPGATPEPIADEDVTGVIQLASERMISASDQTSAALDSATQRIHDESDRTRRLLLSLRPPANR